MNIYIAYYVDLYMYITIANDNINIPYILYFQILSFIHFTSFIRKFSQTFSYINIILHIYR